MQLTGQRQPTPRGRCHVTSDDAEGCREIAVTELGPAFSEHPPLDALSLSAPSSHGARRVVRAGFDIDGNASGADDDSDQILAVGPAHSKLLLSCKGWATMGSATPRAVLFDSALGRAQAT